MSSKVSSSNWAQSLNDQLGNLQKIVEKYFKNRRTRRLSLQQRVYNYGLCARMRTQRDQSTRILNDAMSEYTVKSACDILKGILYYWHSCRFWTCFCCFLLALQNIRTYVYAVSSHHSTFLKCWSHAGNREMKTTHNSFRIIACTFHPQLFSKELYVNFLVTSLFFLFFFRKKKTVLVLRTFYAVFLTNLVLINDTFEP